MTLCPVAWLATLLIVTAQAGSIANRDPDEAIAGWNALGRRHQEGTVRYVRTDERRPIAPESRQPQSGDLLNREVCSVMVSPLGRKCVVDRFDADGRWRWRRIAIETPERSVELGQLVRDGPYYVCSMANTPLERTAVSARVASYFDAVMAGPSWSFGLDKPLAQVFSDRESNTHIDRPEENGSLVKIETMYAPDPSRTKDPANARAQFECDPTHSWRVCKESIQTPTLNMTAQLEYHSDSDDPQTIRCVRTAGSTRHQALFVAEPFDAVAVAPSEFSLQCYGLNEPEVNSRERHIIVASAFALTIITLAINGSRRFAIALAAKRAD
jgi:hypothetical protein